MKYRDSLLPWDEYNAKNITPPYVFTIQKEKQFFVYFGAAHVFDITHPQFERIQSEWREFLKKSYAEDRIVVVEGALRNIGDDITKDVRFGGEGSFITHMAKQENIPVACLEPARNEIMNLLCQEFPREEVYYTWFASLVLQWHKILPVENFETYIQYFFEEDKKNLGWKKFDFSLEHMKTIHHNLFQQEFHLPDLDLFYSIVAPTEKTCITNEISRTESMIRDERIVENMLKFWNSGKSIFVMYGVGHAVVQEPALRGLLK